MLGQLSYFLRATDRVQSTIDRFAVESTRLLGVMNKRLTEADYLGGDYSIADMAAYPWVAAMAPLMKNNPLIPGWDEMTGIHRWLEAIAARPAVQRGMAVPQV